MNKDKVAGTIREKGGKARAAVGRATGDDEAVVRGTTDQMAGNIQKNIGKLKDTLD